jgi:hypothetical protein
VERAEAVNGRLLTFFPAVTWSATNEVAHPCVLCQDEKRIVQLRGFLIVVNFSVMTMV